MTFSQKLRHIQQTNSSLLLNLAFYEALARNGWLWAEYTPGGTVVFSISNRGSGCVSCHSREQGPQNDFVRTFERQR